MKKQEGTGLDDFLKNGPVIEYNPWDIPKEGNIKDYMEFIDKVWTSAAMDTDDIGHVDVQFGWMDDPHDKEHGGYYAESYQVKGGQTIGTGRAGMKNFLEHGFVITKLTINHKDCTDRIEEFKHFILVNDKPFKMEH